MIAAHGGAAVTASAEVARPRIGRSIVRPVAMMGLIVGQAASQAAVTAGAVGRSAFGARILRSAVDDTVRSGRGGHRTVGSRGLSAHDAGIGRATGAGQPEHAEGQSQDNFSIHRLVFLWAGFAEPWSRRRAALGLSFFIGQRTRKMWRIVLKDVFGGIVKVPRSCRIASTAINYRDDFRTRSNLRLAA